MIANVALFVLILAVIFGLGFLLPAWIITLMFPISLGKSLLVVLVARVFLGNYSVSK